MFFFFFLRGYLESFSSVLKTPRMSVGNIISKTDVPNEKSESNNCKINDSIIIDENIENDKQSQGSCVKLKNEV